MALIGNYSSFNKLPLKYIGSTGFFIAAAPGGSRPNFAQSGRVRARMMQSETTVADQLYALPNGAYPSVSWFIPQQAGQIGSSNQIYGEGTLTPNLVGGRNGAASLTGTSTITAPLSLLAALIANLTGAGTASASVIATLLLAGNLTGSGALTAFLNAYAAIQAGLSGTGTLTAPPYGTGNLAADITGVSTLSPENLAAAVWSALAAQYNLPGTMGGLLNDAAAGGGGGGSGLTLAQFLALQNP
jgi:hypothetical protein